MNKEFGEGSNYLQDKGWRSSGLNEYVKGRSSSARNG